MKNYQKTLLAGVAALALAVGTSGAFAQSPSGTQHGDHPSAAQSAPGQGSGQGSGKGSGMSQPGMSQPSEHRGADAGTKPSGSGSSMQPQAQEQRGKSGPAAAQSGKNESAQNPSSARNENAPNATQHGKRSRRDAERADHGRMEHERGMARDEGNRNNQRNMTREGKKGQPSQNSAERERTLHGLQGNAGQPMKGSDNVRFSDRQRTTIKRTIIDARGAPRADHVDFDVRVGAVVPRDSIHVVAVPARLVRIEPSWRGLLYFVYEDEIVIVNPSDMHIVAVVAV